MLIFSFFLALSAFLLQATLFSSLRILAFAPWVALVILRCNLKSTLWLSALIGALLDLLSDDPMGLHALNYSITAAIVYRYKKHFLFDVPLHLSLSTALVSAISTFLQLILLFLFDRRVPFSGEWTLIDLSVMPLLDALYSFIWFAAPLAFFQVIRRIWMVFWLKRKNPSLTSR